MENKSTQGQNTEPAAIFSPDNVKLSSVRLLREYWNKTRCTAKKHYVVQKLAKLSHIAQAVS